MDAITAQVLVGMLNSDLVKDSMSAAVNLICASGRKLGQKAKEYMENQEQGKSPEEKVVPQEVQMEIKGTLKEMLKESTGPIYMDGVALFCDQNRKLSEEEQGTLAWILTSANDDVEDDGEDTPEWAAEYLEIVQEFMVCHYGEYVNPEEKDFVIEDDVIYLNLGFYESEDFYRIYAPDSIRQFVNALNHLLGDKCITRFTVY